MPESVEQADFPPPQIPDHTLIRLIDRGSYGEIWLARNIVGTYRAVKVIYRRAFDHERPYDREFAGIKSFEPISRSHDGLVDILQFGRNDEAGYFYYVMEIADHDPGSSAVDWTDYHPRTLRSELHRRGRLPLPEALQIGLAITGAVECLHGHGLVHRDIKPANIIFAGGKPKLADIGLVAATDETRSYVGTEGFIPPEGPGSPQADLYSLGKVLYEISTGKDRQEYPELPAELSEDPDRQKFAQWNEIIIKACLDDPRKRHRSAGEMRAELTSLLQGQSVTKLRRQKRTRDALQAIGVFVLGLVLLGIGARVFNAGVASVLLAASALIGIAVIARRARSDSPATVALAPAAGNRGPLLASAGLLVAAAWVGFGWMPSNRARDAFPFASRDFILVSDFSNQTGDAVFDKALWTAFTVGLQQSRYANILPRSRINQALMRMGKSPDTIIDETIGREVGQRENVRGLLLCDIATTGGSYVISFRLVNPKTGETVRAYQEKASAKNRVLEALAKMVAEIREDLGESLSTIRQSSSPLPLVTTDSLDALKAYADAQVLWRKGAYNDAVKLYETALSLDPYFAMAHADLGAAYFSFVYNQPSKGKEHYAAALARNDRITVRERLFIEAAYHRDLGHVEETIRCHRLFLDSYPDDTDVRYNLATFLMLNRRSQEAAEQFKEVIRVAPNNTRAIINLATSLNEADQCEEALTCYAKAFKLEPDRLKISNLNSEYAFTLARVRKMADARRVTEMLIEKPDTRAVGMRSLAFLDMYEGKYSSARRRLQEAILLTAVAKQDLSEARNHLFFAILLDGCGERQQAIRELDASSSCLRSVKDPQVFIGARIGIAYARAGQITRSSDWLRYVEPRADPENAESRSHLHRLQGELKLARGQAEEALKLMLIADREFSTPETLASLARAYDLNGSNADTTDYYGKLISNGRASLGWEPQQSWIVAHIRLAEIYIQQREAQKALETLRPILQLWAGADPNLILAKRIRKLGAALETAEVRLSP
jgi:tetratricopeptide (TPR) repeat protein